MEIQCYSNSSFHAVSKPTLFAHSSLQRLVNCNRLIVSLQRTCGGRARRWKPKLKSFFGQIPTISASAQHTSSSHGHGEMENEEWSSNEDWSRFIHVIGIGSRKDAVFDFCLNSPFQLSSLRFWNIVTKNSEDLLLQQMSRGEVERCADYSDALTDMPITIKAKVLVQWRSKAIILVASSGYGLDHSVALNIFDIIRSANAYTVVIVLNPFSFEGLRRQNEVTDLIEKLKGKANLFIDIDTDVLLRNDLVTLDEALRTANNAVLMAINAISVIFSDVQKNLTDASSSGVKEISVPEVHMMLERYEHAKIGFGIGNSIKTAILKSIYECPFLGLNLKDLNKTVMCVIASSSPVNDSEVLLIPHIFSQSIGSTRNIVVSIIHEPNLEPDLLVTTLLALGITEQQTSQNGNIFSSLVQNLPSVFSFWKRIHRQLAKTDGDSHTENIALSEVIESKVIDPVVKASIEHDLDEKICESYQSYEPTVISDNTALDTSSENGLFEKNTHNPSLHSDILLAGQPTFQREQLLDRKRQSGGQLAQQWSKDKVFDTDGEPVTDNVAIFQLPVGVRPSQVSRDSETMQFIIPKESETEHSTREWALDSLSSHGTLNNARFGATQDFLFASLKGKYMDNPKKQGVLSARAAIMLEAERDSPKQWSPIMEIQYRGGIYKGRCQGGLPEGRGHLTLGDGSMYDGMWRCGKRSGSGTFYFRNGDIFQGSWRDDVMHGKGWCYFHNGDRWFANFWKGKANGEGRFYSKSGNVVFGHFEDGWRHGHFFCIKASGARYRETWEHGVLVNREMVDADSEA